MISKVTKAVSISREISDDISVNKELGKSFSSWIEEQYTKIFFSVKSKREKLILLEKEMLKLKEIIRIEEKDLSHSFLGFCPCCGEPIKSYKVVSEHYIICSFCYPERMGEVTVLIEKIIEKSLQKSD